MALANDVSTGGKATTKAVDKSLLSAAKKKAASAPVYVGSDSYRPPPEPEKPFVPTKDLLSSTSPTGDPLAELRRLKAQEHAMKARALAALPEVDPYVEFLGYKPTMGPLADEPLAGSSDEAREGVNIADTYYGNLAEKEDEKRVNDFSVSKADRASQRHRATQQGMRQEGGGRRKVETITREKYDSMTPEQRAAIDLNSMLVEAVRRDRNAVAPKKGVGIDYIENLEDIFGEYAYGGEGSKYAPNTVRLLDKLGFSNNSVELDDVLKLRIAFSAEDVADLKGALSETSLATPEHMRDTVQSELIAAVQGVRKDPQKGSSLLEEQRKLVDYSKVPGFGKDPKSKEFQKWYDIFTRKEFQKEIPEIIKSFKSDHPENPDEVFAEFVNYVNLRSREAMQYRNPLSTDSPELRARPRKLRRRLGM